MATIDPLPDGTRYIPFTFDELIVVTGHDGKTFVAKFVQSDVRGIRVELLDGSLMGAIPPDKVTKHPHWHITVTCVARRRRRG